MSTTLEVKAPHTTPLSNTCRRRRGILASVPGKETMSTRAIPQYEPAMAIAQLPSCFRAREVPPRNRLRAVAARNVATKFAQIDGASSETSTTHHLTPVALYAFPAHRRTRQKCNAKGVIVVPEALARTPVVAGATVLLSGNTEWGTGGQTPLTCDRVGPSPPHFSAEGDW